MLCQNKSVVITIQTHLYSARDEHACLRLSMVPSIRSRRVVPNGGPHLSVAHDLTCFMKFFESYKSCLLKA